MWDTIKRKRRRKRGSALVVVVVVVLGVQTVYVIHHTICYTVLHYTIKGNMKVNRSIYICIYKVVMTDNIAENLKRREERKIIIISIYTFLLIFCLLS